MAASVTPRPSRGDWLVAALIVLATGIAATWPLATSPWLVPDHQDPLFSSWRLYQWSRNLAALGSGGLFSGNMFHPAPNVLLYSDAIPLPALIGAPFILAGVPVVLVYNGLVWLSILSAGLAMYACAHHLSGSHFGALVAAVMFVGAPLRLDHVMHLELLCTAFLPLTVLATARAMEGSTGAAWGIGASLAGQFLSCIYYGVFLLTIWPLLVGVEWLRRHDRPTRAVVWRTAVSLFVAAVVLGAYALPYQQARQVVGERSDSDVDNFSGSFGAYLLSPPTSRLWGWTSGADRQERWLFPGLVGSALAVSAITTPAAPWTAALAVVTLVGADASRGSSGVIYPLLRRWLPPYRGLRVASRFGMLVLAAWSLLAAIGGATLARTIGRRPRAAVLAALLLVLMVVESTAMVQARRLPKDAPPVYAYLATLPPTVLAHAPWPVAGGQPGSEADFIYFAQYHRHRLVNGNSGFYPPWYLGFLERAWSLPSDQTMDALREVGVEYLLVHERYFASPVAFGAAVFRLEQRPDLQPVGTYADERGHADVRVYRVTR